MAVAMPVKGRYARQIIGISVLVELLHGRLRIANGGPSMELIHFMVVHDPREGL